MRLAGKYYKMKDPKRETVYGTLVYLLRLHIRLRPCLCPPFLAPLLCLFHIILLVNFTGYIRHSLALKNRPMVAKLLDSGYYIDKVRFFDFASCYVTFRLSDKNSAQ